jgi:ferrous iron transport protein A
LEDYNSDNYYQKENQGGFIMTLADLNTGDKARVLSINAQDELKKRLFSFGVRKESLVQIINVSMAKSTMEVEVGTTKLAMRFAEAKEIEVQAL